MLSCVWQGVCRALTLMSPMLKVSPCAGVLVTLLQSLPPMMGRGYVLSWLMISIAVSFSSAKDKGVLNLPSRRCRRHGRDGYAASVTIFGKCCEYMFTGEC